MPNNCDISVSVTLQSCGVQEHKQACFCVPVGFNCVLMAAFCDCKGFVFFKVEVQIVITNITSFVICCFISRCVFRFYYIHSCKRVS